MELRPTKISLTGIKASDQVVELDRLNLLLGPPGVGKSSVLSGFRILGVGYEPSRGKREIDTAEVMRESEIEIRMDLSDGRWCSRRFLKKGESLKGEVRCSWLPPTATNTEAGEAIRSLFGADDVEAAEHLDISELMSATPNARAARIESMLAATAMKPAEQQRLLLGLTLCRLAEVDESRLPENAMSAEFTKSTEGMTALLDAPVAARIQRVAGPISEEARTGGVAAALATANAKKRESAQGLRQKTAARTELENKSMALAAPAATLEELNERRQRTTDRIAELRGALERAETTRRAQIQATEARTKAIQALDSHPRRREGIERLRAEISAKHEELKAVADPAPVAPMVLLEPDQAKASRANDLMNEARALDMKSDTHAGPRPLLPVLPEPLSTHAHQGDVQRARDALERARTGPWTKILGHADAIEKRLRGTPQANDCASHIGAIRVTCEANGGGDVVPCERALAAAERALKDAERAADTARKANDALASRYADACEAWDARLVEASEFRHAATSKRHDAERLRTEALTTVAERNDAERKRFAQEDAAHATALAVCQRTRKRLSREIEIAQESIDRETDVLAEEDRTAASADGKVAGVRAARPEDLSGAPKEIETLQASVDAIDAQKRDVEGADARVREMSTLAAEIEAIGADHEILTALEWALQRLRERDMAARGGPLVERMRTFLRAAGFPHDPFLRAGKGATHFGWTKNGKEIKIRSLGGGESVTFMAALATAIIALRKPAMRVLLVEAAETGVGALATGLLAGIQAMKNEIDVAIVATCVEPTIPPGWGVIEYDAKDASVPA